MSSFLINNGQQLVSTIINARGSSFEDQMLALVYIEPTIIMLYLAGMTDITPVQMLTADDLVH